MLGISFSTAAVYVLPFGKYAKIKKTLDQIAEDDDGLMYLDWLIGQTWLRDPARSMVCAYLNDPGIASEVDRVLRQRRAP